jgi:regulator of replication initiation timing
MSQEVQNQNGSLASVRKEIQSMRETINQLVQENKHLNH